MIITEIHLENYTTYYGEKSFKIGPRLNIIVGENNHGKTQLYKALHWLVTGSEKDLTQRVSEKKLKESSEHENFNVGVKIVGEQFGEKRTISRSFSAENREDGTIRLGKPKLEATIKKTNGEQFQAPAEAILEQMFDRKMTKYLFFEGEKSIHETFSNDEALSNLTRHFSGAHQYDDFSKRAKELLGQFDAVIEKETKKNQTRRREYQLLELEVNQFKQKIELTEGKINDKEKELKKVSKNITDVENQIENAEELETSDKIISKLTNDISTLRASVQEDYTSKLFDDRWILYAFEPILNEYSHKITEADKKRRKEDHADIRRKAKEKGIEEGKQQGINAMLGDVLPLNINVPDKETMEELIHDQICKVCNREAKEGTEAYAFMKRRLETLIKQQTPKKQNTLSLEEEEVPLFQNNFLNSLIRIRDEYNDKTSLLREIDHKIIQDFDLNISKEASLKTLREDLEKAEANREGIVGTSATSSKRLADNLVNYRAWRKDETTLKGAIFTLKNDVDLTQTQLDLKTDQKQKIEAETAISSMVKNQQLAQDIATILYDTRQKKFEQFAEKLEKKANDYYKKINEGGFTANITFEVSKSFSGEMEIDLKLKQRDGKEIIISTQGRATETSVYLSCMFALSEMSSIAQNESFPLILDAPISSFGRTKSSQFLEVVSALDFQILLTSKDYTDVDTDENIVFVVPEFPTLIERMRSSKATATWVNLERGFDDEQRDTLNTLTIEL